jgi:MFS family permease
MSSDPSSSGRAELRRGWPIILVAAVGVGTGLSPLPIYSLGVFTKAISADFGWGRGQVQLMLAFFTLGALIGTPIMGAIMDRRGVRPVVLISTLGFGIGMAALGLLTNSLATFYALSFLTALVGPGTSPVAWSRAIFEWFTLRRGLGLGLALTGTGFAAFLIPSYTTWVLGRADWRLGYVALAVLPILISLPLSYRFLRPAPAPATPAEQAQKQSGYRLGEAVRSYRFWIIGIGFFLASLGTGGVATSIVPMLTDRGFDPQRAALVAGAQGLAVVFGRALTGYLLDRLWAPGLAAFVFALPAGACLVLSGTVGEAAIAAGAVALVGFAGGAEFDLIAYLTARYFGMKHFGLVYGVLYSIFVSASGIAPAIFGRAYDITGSYQAILEVAAACFVVGGIMVLTLGRYPDTPNPPRGDEPA